jgi:hypothetical protein
MKNKKFTPILIIFFVFSLIALQLITVVVNRNNEEIRNKVEFVHKNAASLFIFPEFVWNSYYKYRQAGSNISKEEVLMDYDDFVETYKSEILGNKYASEVAEIVQTVTTEARKTLTQLMDNPELQFGDFNQTHSTAIIFHNVAVQRYTDEINRQLSGGNTLILILSLVSSAIAIVVLLMLFVLINKHRDQTTDN